MTAATSTLLTEPTPQGSAGNRGRIYRHDQIHERDLRNAAEAWARDRWPRARICHELVLNSGDVRIDLAAIEPDRLIVIELKSHGDAMSRALHQTGMSCLAADEAWIVTAQRHGRDTELVRYLLPQLGVAAAVQDQAPTWDPEQREEVGGSPWRIEVKHPPGCTGKPHPRAMLNLLWAAELRDEAGRNRVPAPSKATRTYLMAEMESLLSPADIRRAVCRALRRRDALWRADAPLSEADA